MPSPHVVSPPQHPRRVWGCIATPIASGPQGSPAHGDQITSNEQHLGMGAGDSGDRGKSPVPLQQTGTSLGTPGSTRPMGFAARFGVTPPWHDPQYHL